MRSLPGSVHLLLPEDVMHEPSLDYYEARIAALAARVETLRPKVEHTWQVVRRLEARIATASHAVGRMSRQAAYDQLCHEAMHLEDELHRLVTALTALHAEVDGDEFG